MMDLNPYDLRYFFQIGETLNISRAAEKLGVGQPALSQALRRLEGYFGAKLFDRYKTGVRLTAAGRRLYAKGRGALEAWDKLREEIVASDTLIEGRYTLGCHPSVALYAVPGFLKNLLTAHSKLEINLWHGLSREVVESVVSFRLDFGIAINPVKHPDLVIRQLCRDQVGCWMSTGGLKNTLIYDPSLLQSQDLLRKLAKADFFFERKLESSNLEVIGALTEAGCGVGVLPQRVAERFKGLKPLPGQAPTYEDRLCLVYRADRKMSAAGRMIVDSIVRTQI